MQPMHDPWQPVDPLGQALYFLRMSGAFYCRSELTARWGLTVPAIGRRLPIRWIWQTRLSLSGGETRRTTMLADGLGGEQPELVRSRAVRFLEAQESGVPTRRLISVPEDQHVAESREAGIAKSR